MGALHARLHIRRGIGVLAAVLLLMSVAPQPSALADTAAEWQGSFTAAYADPAVVGLDQWSAVRFVVSQPLQNGVSAAWVVIRDAKGVAVTSCNSGTECVWNFNPAPGATETFTAQLSTARNGQSVVIDTAGPVSVTDIGWSGDFSYARADNPSPAVDVATYVRFGVTEPLDLAYLHVNDEMGAIVADCSQGVECVIPVNPSSGEVKTYTATLRVYLDGHWVDRSTRSVTVTDPGWTGTISPDTSNPGFVQANTQAWFHFTTTAPPYSTTINVYVDGALQASCGGNGNANCGANFPVGTNEVHVVRADVIPYLIGGTQEVRASATSVVTSMTSEQFAEALLSDSPPPQLAGLLTPQVLEALAEFKAAPSSLETCVKIGGILLGNKKYDGTAADSTLDCTVIATLAVAVLTAALKSNDVQSVLSAIVDVFIPSASASTDPTPQPQPDPIVPGGPNDPPATVVDTCQIPPGQDPDVFYFYQRTWQAEKIFNDGFRAVGAEGKVWLAPVLYASASQAMGPLALPDPPPDGYFEIPRDRLQDLYGPYCVDPKFGQPGGGIEYWTTQSIDMGGLVWHPFP